MKSIDTLVDDIHSTVGAVEDVVFPNNMTHGIGDAYVKQVNKRAVKKRDPKTIYFSELGDVCQRRMWFKHHTPEKGEVLRPETRIKFLYGDMLESLVLQLATDAGHDVSAEQQEVEYVNDATGWRVRGRIDAVVDGVVVDVKSVTKQSERKFHDGLVDDPFGYLGQLNGYATVLKNPNMGFLTIQKELGHINYFPFTADAEMFGHGFARAVKAIDRDDPVEKVMASVPQSPTSKNEKLCATCSYCPFKASCFPDVRAFAYSNKVEWLTKVVDTPRVHEIDWKKGITIET